MQCVGEPVPARGGWRLTRSDLRSSGRSGEGPLFERLGADDFHHLLSAGRGTHITAADLLKRESAAIATNDATSTSSPQFGTRISLTDSYALPLVTLSVDHAGPPGQWSIPPSGLKSARQEPHRATIESHSSAFFVPQPINYWMILLSSVSAVMLHLGSFIAIVAVDSGCGYCHRGLVSRAFAVNPEFLNSLFFHMGTALLIAFAIPRLYKKVVTPGRILWMKRWITTFCILSLSGALATVVLYVDISISTIDPKGLCEDLLPAHHGCIAPDAVEPVVMITLSLAVLYWLVRRWMQCAPSCDTNQFVPWVALGRVAVTSKCNFSRPMFMPGEALGDRILLCFYLLSSAYCAHLAALTRVYGLLAVSVPCVLCIMIIHPRSKSPWPPFLLLCCAAGWSGAFIWCCLVAPPHGVYSLATVLTYTVAVTTALIVAVRSVIIYAGCAARVSPY